METSSSDDGFNQAPMDFDINFENISYIVSVPKQKGENLDIFLIISYLKTRTSGTPWWGSKQQKKLFELYGASLVIKQIKC